MPSKPPRICPYCRKVVPAGQRCACQKERRSSNRARADAKRPTAHERGYTSKWRRYRKEFLEENPDCARCGAPATVVDHIVRPEGDERLFWLKYNHAPLCASCHNSYKQRVERST